MEELTTTAQAMAEAAYEASDQYKAVQDAERQSLDALRENTAALEASTAAYGLAQERTKGNAGGLVEMQRQSGVTGLIWTPIPRNTMPHLRSMTRVKGGAPDRMPSGWNGCPMTTIPPCSTRASGC